MNIKFSKVALEVKSLREMLWKSNYFERAAYVNFWSVVFFSYCADTHTHTQMDRSENSTLLHRITGAQHNKNNDNNSNANICKRYSFKVNELMLPLWMLNIRVSFFSILFKFVQTFVPSVNKLPNARCQERCWLLWSYPSYWRTTDCTSESDTNFCPPSIFFIGPKRVVTGAKSNCREGVVSPFAHKND